MADRLNFARGLLVKNLQEVGSKLNWDHLNSQVGMFSFTVKNKRKKTEIYKGN